MWKMVKLKDVLTYEKVNGQGSSLPYLGMENISSDTMQIVGELEIPASTSSTFKFDNTHVLYGRLRPYLKKVLVPNFEGQCSTEVFCLKPSSSLNRKFLAYWLLSPKISDKIENTSTGARMPRANMNAILEFDFFLPPLAEQQRIVAKLDAAFAEIDEQIELTGLKVESVDNLRETVLVNLFEKVEKTAPKKHLNEVCSQFARGKSKHRPRNDERLYGDMIPFVQTGDVSGAKKYLNQFSKKYSDFGIQQSKIWHKGTVCITIAANIAELAILEMDACFPDSVIGASPDVDVTSSEYLYYLLNFYQKKIKAKSKGSAQQNINLGTFADEQFPFPSVQEQIELVENFSKIENHIREVRQTSSKKIAALSSLKSAILARELQSEAA